MLTWGFGRDYQFGKSHVPGQAPIAVGSRIMQSNPLEIDLEACQNYTNGDNAAAQVTSPSQLILANYDKMTPKANGLELADKINGSTVTAVDAGHMLPIEAPDQCLDQLRHFITSLN